MSTSILQPRLHLFFIAKITQLVQGVSHPLIGYGHFLDISEDIIIASCMEIYAWIGGIWDHQYLRSDYTRIMLQDYSDAQYHTRTDQETRYAEEVILTNLKMHPIPVDHIHPIYYERLVIG